MTVSESPVLSGAAPSLAPVPAGRRLPLFGQGYGGEFVPLATLLARAGMGAGRWGWGGYLRRDYSCETNPICKGVGFQGSGVSDPKPDTGAPALDFRAKQSQFPSWAGRAVAGTECAKQSQFPQDAQAWARGGKVKKRVASGGRAFETKPIAPGLCEGQVLYWKGVMMNRTRTWPR